MTIDRIDRLPVWAQDHIRNLTRQLTERDARIAELCNGVPGSPLSFGFHSERRQTLPPTGHLRLQLDARTWLEVEARDGGLRVSGSRALFVQPHVSNAVRIVCEPD